MLVTMQIGSFPPAVFTLWGCLWRGIVRKINYFFSNYANTP